MIDHSGKLKTEKIIESVQDSIVSGELKINSKMPSISQMAAEFEVANETVVKAYKKLKEQGIISSVHGKGFFVAKTDLSVKRHVFVLFDALTSYKETLYKSMMDEFGQKASLDVYFHHFNIQLFESLIREAAGNYTDYIVLPFYDRKVKPVLELIPRDKLYIIDCYMDNFSCQGVFQDFKNDVYHALSSGPFRAKKYKKLNFVYRGDCNYIVSGIISGFSAFCNEQHLEYSISDGKACPQVEKANAYLTLDDEYLVDLVLQARELGYQLGTDAGIISYNDTALKKIAEGGISVISTDFSKMGRDIASMILRGDADCRRNPVMFIDRGSF